MLKRYKYTIAVALLILVGIIVAVACLLPRNKAVFVNANPNSGFNYGYYYYIPNNVKNTSEVYILVQPNNTGTVSDDYEVHKQSAKDMIENSLESLADRLGCVLLVPVFDRPQSNDLMYTHALDRDTILNDTGMLARIDLQLISMVEDFKMLLNSKEITAHHKILLNGFSASGTFSNRFTALHPDMIQAVATGGINSMPILPIAEIDGSNLIYPVGIFDIKEITGREFDFDTYTKIPQFIYMGAKDDNDTLPYDDAFGSNEKKIIIDVLGEEMQKRFERSKDIYMELGCSAEFVLYDNVGHEETNEIREAVTEFFRLNMTD